MATDSNLLEVGKHCSNCRHLGVCKYTNEIIRANDLLVNTFNSENFQKNRIRISAITYDCRHKITQ